MQAVTSAGRSIPGEVMRPNAGNALYQDTGISSSGIEEDAFFSIMALTDGDMLGSVHPPSSTAASKMSLADDQGGELFCSTFSLNLEKARLLR